jgi:hypothetical protein
MWQRTLFHMRVVGNQDRTEIELDPVKAHLRTRILDGLLRRALPPYPRGVWRGTHEYFNRLDALRQAEIARRLNGT